MGDEESDVIKALVHEAARPFVGVITDLVGIAGGDALSRFRKRLNAKHETNQRDTIEVAHKLIEERKVQVDESVPPEKIVELLEEAEQHSEQALKDLFGRLLAALLDPTRSSSYRREFIEIVRKLEPLDAAVLPLLNTSTAYDPSRKEHIAHVLTTSQDQIELAFRNLARLELIEDNPQSSRRNAPWVSALGRQFLSIVH